MLLYIIIVRCDDPTFPNLGSIDGGFNEEGQNRTYRCLVGFRPSADYITTCSNTTLWDPPPEDFNCILVLGMLLKY